MDVLYAHSITKRGVGLTTYPGRKPTDVEFAVFCAFPHFMWDHLICLPRYNFPQGNGTVVTEQPSFVLPSQDGPYVFDYGLVRNENCARFATRYFFNENIANVIFTFEFRPIRLRASRYQRGMSEEMAYLLMKVALRSDHYMVSLRHYENVSIMSTEMGNGIAYYVVQKHRERYGMNRDEISITLRHDKDNGYLTQILEQGSSIVGYLGRTYMLPQLRTDYSAI